MIVEYLFTLCEAIAGVLAGLLPNPVPAWLVSSAASLGYVLGWCKSYSVFIPWDVLFNMTVGLIATSFVYFGYHAVEYSLHLIHLIG